MTHQQDRKQTARLRYDIEKLRVGCRDARRQNYVRKPLPTALAFLLPYASVHVAPHRRSNPLALHLLEVEAVRFLSDATGVLIGHRHADSLAYAAATAAVPSLATVAVIDRISPTGSTRVIAGSSNPANDDAHRRAVGTILPPPLTPGSPLAAVASAGRVLARAEMSEAALEAEDFSMLCVPVVGSERILATLSLVTFGRHDRYGRPELALAEEFAERLGRALDAVEALTIARDAAQSAAAHREVLQHSVSSLEKGLSELKEASVALIAENAALRAMHVEGGGPLVTDLPGAVPGRYEADVPPKNRHLRTSLNRANVAAHRALPEPT